MTGIAIDPNEPEPFFTPAGLGKFLNISDSMVWKLLRQGAIKSYRIGRARRISPADVDSYLQERREERDA